MITRKPGAATVGAFVIMSALAPAMLADDQFHAQHGSGQRQAAALVKIVRESTERFRHVAVAQAEGYNLLFGCATGPDAGAMGMHFVNLPLVGDSELDPTRPEIVIYEPRPNRQLRLIGADYLVLADAWNAKQL